NDIITPSTGKKIHVRSVYCCTDADSGTVSLDFATSSKPVLRLYAAKFKTCQPININISGATNEALTLNTTTGTNKVFLVVSFVEE
ncbi:MAG: hypothetical protein ACTSSA_15170, partial [Candidatus Freyarchaeota archaeon]